ncbi:hypothetical protein K3495_g6308 [Podosphaera aphanis]|nr:hypothetical protein K3495_g6308 [Podosphaera aphanis]
MTPTSTPIRGGLCFLVDFFLSEYPHAFAKDSKSFISSGLPRNSVKDGAANLGIADSSSLGYHLHGALDQVDQGLENFYNFDRLTAMKWSLAAWKEVSTQTISNCFKHTRLFEESIPKHTLHTLEADEQSIDLGLHEAFNRLAVRNAMLIANLLNPIEEDQGAIEE